MPAGNVFYSSGTALTGKTGCSLGCSSARAWKYLKLCCFLGGSGTVQVL